jgi:2-polyprenyl-3-methyl-5-hydroxy-6-metoxy-1,4-benzoquinol methylase
MGFRIGTYPDESFDTVFCAAVLHHIADPVAVKRTVITDIP